MKLLSLGTSAALALARHPDAVGEIDRPVIDRGKDVAMEVDHSANPRSGVVWRRRVDTMTGMIHHLAPLGLRRRNGLQRE